MCYRLFDQAAQDHLVETLVYHQRASIRYCTCGWGELGRSHAEHVLDVFIESMVARGVW